jgi:hypothetical protein
MQQCNNQLVGEKGKVSGSINQREWPRMAAARDSVGSSAAQGWPPVTGDMDADLLGCVLQMCSVDMKGLT